MSNDLLFHYKSNVRIGEVERYIITYTLYEGETIPDTINLDSLWLKVRNIEPLSYRAGYLMGPFILYCDLRTEKYHHSQKIFASVDQPQFEPNLIAQKERYFELSLHKIQKKYVWILDIASQIIFATNTSISFEVSIGKTKDLLYKSVEITGQLESFSNKLIVTRLNTLDLWKLPTQISSYKKKHLVILTHGLHSNITADMAYIQEQLYKTQRFSDDQIVVEGYTGNVCQTEKGIKYLGSRVAEYIVNELYDQSVTKISFIGHSLGGLVQTFAIAYIAVKYPWFFERIEPESFITMASPLLGIVTDNPAFVKALLSFGVIGKTGQDLGLGHMRGDKPLLYLLPGEPVRSILTKFKRRTIYANAINDGVVPLYTASLLFLDYNDILDKMKKVREEDTKQEVNNVTIGENTDFFNKNFISPLSKMLSIWAPHTSEDRNSKLPKLSIFESATSILLPPLPDKEYIMNPSSRSTTIIHDKVYTEDDIPSSDNTIEDTLFNSKNILLEAFASGADERLKYHKLEETIARRWHKGLSWRKVIVALKPDAHNNMIARRRFANAYGWPVIDHLINEHFIKPNTEQLGSRPDLDEFSISNKCEGGFKILSEKKKDYEWITKDEETTIFDEGPTGMISTMSNMFDNFAKRKFSSETTNMEGEDPQDEVFRFEEDNNDLLQQ